MISAPAGKAGINLFRSIKPQLLENILCDSIMSVSHTYGHLG